jgi:hypothetical protein
MRKLFPYVLLLCAIAPIPTFAQRSHRRSAPKRNTHRTVQANKPTFFGRWTCPDHYYQLDIKRDGSIRLSHPVHTGDRIVKTVARGDTLVLTVHSPSVTSEDRQRFDYDVHTHRFVSHEGGKQLEWSSTFDGYFKNNGTRVPLTEYENAHPGSGSESGTFSRVYKD